MARETLFEIAAAHVGIQERLGGDGQREVHHLGVQIALVPRPPVGEHSLGLRDHDAGIGLDVRALKGRLDQAFAAAAKLRLRY